MKITKITNTPSWWAEEYAVDREPEANDGSEEERLWELIVIDGEWYVFDQMKPWLLYRFPEPGQPMILVNPHGGDYAGAE